MFMGDGLVPTPKKLLNKICNLEFIEMQELMPENWPDLFTEEQSKLHSIFGGEKRAPPVMNITWIECYSSLVAVSGTRKIKRSIQQVFKFNDVFTWPIVTVTVNV